MSCPFDRLELEERKEESDDKVRRQAGKEAVDTPAVRGRGEGLAMAAITAALAVVTQMMTAGGTSGRANPANFSAPTTFAIAEQLVADEAARHQGRKLPSKKAPVAGGSGGRARSGAPAGGGKFFQADTFRANAKKLLSDPSGMYTGWDAAAWVKSGGL